MRAAFSSERSDGDEDPQPIVGMWHVLFTAEGNEVGPPNGTPIDNAIVVWHRDKTEVMNSGRPPQDGDFCMGVWEVTGKGKYKLNHFAWGKRYHQCAVWDRESCWPDSHHRRGCGESGREALYRDLYAGCIRYLGE